jgi:MFS family permease
MYVSLRNQPHTASAAAPPVRRRVAHTVLLLGAVSMVTDISTESVGAVLPNYLIVVIGLSPQAFGVVNGLYNGVSALVRILGGWAADATDRPKWIAFIGYAISAAGKIALMSAHSFPAFSAIASTDQVGKGLRTAPRDAMIVASSEPDMLGRAFGVHRALDTLGAFIGPLLAFWILFVVPNDFHSVFVTAAAFSLIGVATMLLMVPDLRPRSRRAALARPTGEAPSAVDVGDRAERPRLSLRLLATPDLARLTVAAGLLGLLSIGETYVFLELQDRDELALTYYPLLIVGMNFAYLVLAVPFGRLADRIGRWPVFIGGYVALLIAYVGAGGPVGGVVITCLCLLLIGAYYAATDGMLAAMAGQATSVAVRSSAIATAQTVVAATAFLASVLFAALWTAIGRADALLVVAAGLAATIPVAAALLRRTGAARRPPGRADSMVRA